MEPIPIERFFRVNLGSNMVLSAEFILAKVGKPKIAAAARAGTNFFGFFGKRQTKKAKETKQTKNKVKRKEVKDSPGEDVLSLPGNGARK